MTCAFCGKDSVAKIIGGKDNPFTVYLCLNHLKVAVESLGVSLALLLAAAKK